MSANAPEPVHEVADASSSVPLADAVSHVSAGAPSPVPVPMPALRRRSRRIAYAVALGLAIAATIFFGWYGFWLGLGLLIIAKVGIWSLPLIRLSYADGERVGRSDRAAHS